MLPDEAPRRLKLWFFRDLTEEQRKKLFALAGFPVEDITNQMSEALCLEYVINQIRESKP